MNTKLSKDNQSEIEEVIRQLRKAVAAKKCWSCECFRNSLIAIEKTIVPMERTLEINAVIRAGREHLAPVKYDCLGCDKCYPALVINRLETLYGSCGGFEVCSSCQVEARVGWPPLPGTYTVLRYRAPVAICALTDEALAISIASKAVPDIAIVGTLQTENLGIERLISNIIANPNIRFLIMCGADSQQAVGHLPGQSLISLAHSGIDSDARILGARGKRPVLRNLSLDAVNYFRTNIEVIDIIGNKQIAEIIDTVKTCSEQNRGKAEPFASEQLLKPITGYLSQRVIPDPAGYFIIYVDRNRQVLSLEHYQNDGLLDIVIEGKVAAELYYPAIEKGLVSQLEHAAYLGRELARAEQSLVSGDPFVQDAAPERNNGVDNNSGCSCGSSCI